MLEVIHEKNYLILRLNRPDVKNAMNSELIEKLTQAFQVEAKKTSVRLVQIEAAGEVFSAGADLNYMQSMVSASREKNLQEAEKLRNLFQSIYDCAVPVLCLVQGSAFGGALGLMAASDFVIADEKAKFCFSEVKLGLAPAVISEFVLKKSVRSHVIPWMLSGGVFDSKQAHLAGLVHMIAASGIETAAQDFKDAILGSGPQAVATTKALLRDLDALEPKQIAKRTTNLIADLRVSPEGQEGIKSFLEKRKPNWVSK